MADSDVPGLSALTGANLADGDLFHVVDVSDTSAAGDGTDKRITADEMRRGVTKYLFPIPTAGNYYGNGFGIERELPRIGDWVTWSPLLLSAGDLDLAGFHLLTAGDTGDVLKVGIYEDDGNAAPGSLLDDWGSFALDGSVPSDVENSISTTLPYTGLYWIGDFQLATGAAGFACMVRPNESGAQSGYEAVRYSGAYGQNYRRMDGYVDAGGGLSSLPANGSAGVGADGTPVIRFYVRYA